MSVDIEKEGGFSGSKRQAALHYRLFTLLSGYDGTYQYRNGHVEHYKNRDIVFSWLIDIKGWQVLKVTDCWIFASLARALPGSDFSYSTDMIEEVGPGEKIINEVIYRNSAVFFYSLWRRYISQVKTFWDEKNKFQITIDKEGYLTGDADVVQQCLSAEKAALSDLLVLMETGTDDPQQLLDIGMICETGLAGVEKDLTKAWDFYLKAADKGSADALAFISEIFAEEDRAELRELLKNKHISREAYPVLFGLGAAWNDAELTALLLDYRKNLEE